MAKRKETTQHSKLYKTIKRMYHNSEWSDSDVAMAVWTKLITEEEYEKITGRPYR